MNGNGRDDNDSVSGLYRGVIQQVLVIENCKKELASKILMIRGDRRWQLIQEFLRYDLEKHLLLEQAAVIVINNGATEMIEDLEKLYQFSSGEDLISKIRQEGAHIENFIKIIERGRKHKNWLSFTERRVMQEIDKYVIEQAREYNKL
ncbi:hypothetical protein [Syntrophomonas curvata]